VKSLQSVSTLAGIQKQGTIGLIYKVDATVVGFQVCSLVDASEQTCVPTASLMIDGLYHSIEIPITFGATSAGIKVKSTSSTGNVFVDNAFVKQGLGISNLNTGVEKVTIQKFTVSGAATYTPTAGTQKIKIRMIGGGGGSSGSGSAGAGNGGNGGQSYFSSWSKP
jgi:hypothetical protein